MASILSMTGFSAAQSQYQERGITCEIRSVNSRYLEISLKLPRLLFDLENPIKEIIRGKVNRGKIFYNLSFISGENENNGVTVDPNNLHHYINLLNQVKSAAGIDTPISLDHLLSFKDLFTMQEKTELDDALVKTVEEISLTAVEQLNEMRRREGEHLKNDIDERLKVLKRLTGEIREHSKGNARIEFEKLTQRLFSLIDEEKVDRSRLEQELAIISDRVDITEELVRMDSHLELFEQNLEKGSPVGKKLNFILQEMNREANTLGNKTTLIEISHRVVAIKEEIEKLREQIQNIE
ncbi:MAG: YicC/YloC family endoribonuclease [Calditrichia bacterium]